jgi:hypothetical protein
MGKDIYSKYVHEFIDQTGSTRYAVAEYNGKTYSRPADRRSIELTGSRVESTASIEMFGGYLSKRKALRRARYLFSDPYCVDQLRELDNL